MGDDSFAPTMCTQCDNARATVHLTADSDTPTHFYLCRDDVSKVLRAMHALAPEVLWQAHPMGADCHPDLMGDAQVALASSVQCEVDSGLLTEGIEAMLSHPED